MVDVWFALVSSLLVAYVVLDGFDLGAGGLHRWVARTDAERREVISAIGPFWDGNEVFLLAAGGTMFVAFSKVIAAALSGLYLGVMIILWVMLLRGIAIEFRSLLRDSMWRSFWDTIFQSASAALALLLGVALGNLLRGFPLQTDGYFAMELLSFQSPRLGLGVVDLYTLSTGVFSLLVLLMHGARFLVLRTDGAVRARAAHFAEGATTAVAVAWTSVTLTTWFFARPALTSFFERPSAWVLAVMALITLTTSWRHGRKGNARAAFVASCAFVTSLVGIAVASTHPFLLRSTTPEIPSITARAAANDAASLAAGLRWWGFAAVLVVLYFVNLFRLHSGMTTYGEGAEHDAEEPDGAGSPGSR